MNQTVYRRRPTSSIPNVIFGLLIANGLVFALQQMNAEFMFINFALWPATDPRSPFMPWQLLTYGFLHGNTTHIFFNMFGLWMFGAVVERSLGSNRFLTFYGLCVLGASLLQLLVVSAPNYMTEPGASLYPTVGASGGVLGVLAGFAMLYPNEKIFLLFLPIPIPAKWFVLGYAAMDVFGGFGGYGSNIAHFAHLGGMITGALLILYWRRQNQLRGSM